MRCASVRGVVRKAFAISFSYEPAHLTQSEGNVSFGRERWMDAAEWKIRRSRSSSRLSASLALCAKLTALRDIARAPVPRRIKSCPATQRINGFESGGRNQPWTWVIGHSALRPETPARVREEPRGRAPTSARSKSPGGGSESQDSSRIHAIEGIEQFHVSARWNARP